VFGKTLLSNSRWNPNGIKKKGFDTTTTMSLYKNEKELDATSFL
jgi:hypothetical protein